MVKLWTLLVTWTVLSVITLAQKEGKTKECTKDGQYIAGDDGRSYIKCSVTNDTKIARHYLCPPSKCFSSNQCVPILGGGEIVQKISKKTRQDFKLYPHKKHKDKYIMESPCGTLVLQCSKNNNKSGIYDPDLKVCSGCVTPKASKICIRPGLFPIPGNESRYYACIDNGLGSLSYEEKSCFNDTVFSPSLLKCVRIFNDTIPYDENNDNNGTIIFPVCVKSGWFRVPNNCQRFFCCTKKGSKFQQKRYKCSSNKAFSVKLRKCVNKELVPECYEEGLKCCKSGIFPMKHLKGYYTCKINSRGVFDKSIVYCLKDQIYCVSLEKCIPLNGQMCYAEGLFSLGSECGKYINCTVNGDDDDYMSTVHRCDQGMAFDDVLMKCTTEQMNECVRKKEIMCSNFKCNMTGTFALDECSGTVECRRVKGLWIKKCKYCEGNLSYSKFYKTCTSIFDTDCREKHIIKLVKTRKKIYVTPDRKLFFMYVNNNNNTNKCEYYRGKKYYGLNWRRFGIHKWCNTTLTC